MPEVTKLKIPLVEWRPYFQATGNKEFFLPDVEVKGTSFSFKTNFLLDTGSPLSILFERDSKLKAALRSQASRTYTSTAIGDIPLNLKKLGRCTLRMKAETGDEVSLEQDLYWAVRRGLRDGVLRIPMLSIKDISNLLGLDFLESHNLGITSKNEKGIRYLFRD